MRTRISNAIHTHPQEDLWTLDCIPSIQDGETLFSWCALYHRISGATFAETTSRRLFNSSTGGFIRDFPGRIEQFVQITDGALGDSDHIINEHTLLRLYTKFRSDVTMAKVRAMMRGPSVERLRFILGLPSSRANSCHPLKFCMKCVAEEVEEFGIARWWINSQWPTVWVCEQHGQLLGWARDGTRGSARSAWFLPSDLKTDEIVSAKSISIDTECLTELARLTINLANHHEVGYSPEILKLAFLEMIKERGWVSAYGSIQYADMRDAFLKKYEDMSELPGMEFIHSIYNENYGFMGTVIRGRNKYLHPSKFLLMINFLFEDYQSFQAVYKKYSETSDVAKVKMQILDPDRELREEMLRTLIVIEKCSLNQVSRLLSMSIVNVIAWARKNGIEYEQRPRLETEQLLSTIRKLISQGAGRDEMVTVLAVRRRWIMAFFKRHPDLREEWEQNHQNSVIQKRRAAFRQLVEKHQGVPLRELLSIPANGYMWLLKHDGQWLEDNLPLMS